jgi:prepilin signal peptidase PulO-like enzyme (type II secretory pathway)
MDVISISFIFILGTLIGSFINVVALRYNSGLSVYNDRSKCFNCNNELSWYELIPIISYIVLRGKCKTCKSSVSLQYPIVEFLTGVVFVAIALRQYSLWYFYSGFSNGLTYSILFFVYYCVVFSLLMVVSIYDIKHKIIPDIFSYTFIILAVLKLLLFFYCKYKLSTPITNMDILDLFAPLIYFTPFALLWLISGGRWIGFGDAKLAFGVGALLGFVLGSSAIVLSFWLGAAYGVFAVLRGRFSVDPAKKLGMSSEVPFAPFMILALFIVFLTRIDILSLGSIFDLIN